MSNRVPRLLLTGAVSYFVGFILVVTLLSLTGCSLFSDPKIPAPKGVSVPAGTPLSITEYEAEVQNAKVAAEAAQKAEEEAAIREASKIHRQAQTAVDTVVADSADAIAELGTKVSKAGLDRKVLLSNLDTSLAAAKTSIANRQSFLDGVLAVGTQAIGVAAPMIPGGSLIAPLLLGAVGLFAGHKVGTNGADAKVAEANAKVQVANDAAQQARDDHESHVDALDHAADVNPALKAALDAAKPLIAEWQTPSSAQAARAFTAGA